jgi:serpin B
MRWPRSLSALAFALLGCEGGPSGPKTPVYPSSDPVVNDVVQGNTAFAADLYGRLRSKPGNLFFSPESISMALAMATAGARGETLAEMQQTMHFRLDPARLHAAFGGLLAAWRAPAEPSPNPEAASLPELFLANRLWCQAGFTLSPDFVAITRDQYGAPVEQVDFIKSSDPARETINRWVEEQTHDKIKDLLAPGTITPDTRIVITNAIYFKAAWASPFVKEATKNEPFFTDPSKGHPVPMMHRSKAQAGYAEVSHAKVLEMPYLSHDSRRSLSLLVVLPDDKDGLPELEADLSEKKISSWVSELRQDEVDVALPRFKITAEMELVPLLQQMGMKRAFTEVADFSGITTEMPLMIAHVVHKAFVDVNEAGTEAAAATAAVMIAVGMVVRPRPPPVFRADHPFLLILRDRTNGSVLFMGRVVDPVA